MLNADDARKNVKEAQAEVPTHVVADLMVVVNRLIRSASNEGKYDVWYTDVKTDYPNGDAVAALKQLATLVANFGYLVVVDEQHTRLHIAWG